MITQKIIARTDSLKLDKIISRYGEDSMRQVVFIIVRPDPESEDLIPITIPEDAVGSFRILKPSGNFVIVPMSKSVLASGETAFDVVLPASANTAKGSGYYDIRITSETDKYYFTAQGDFIIDDNIISDEVLEDVSEVNGLIFPDDFLTVEDHVAYIDDDTISTDSTWSSNKINEEIEAHAGGDVSKTVSGNPVTFTDGASAPLVKCVTEIQGSQDLHGYDKPWVGGAGKNKFDKSSTILGTSSVGWWINVAESKLSPGGSSNSTFAIPCKGNTTYTLSANITGTVFRVAYGTMENLDFATTGSTPQDLYNVNDSTGSDKKEVVLTTGANATFIFVQLSYSTYSTDKNSLQMELGTSATSYEPYSNICPITAYTEGEIEVRGKNILPLVLSELKTINTAGTWNNNVYTLNNINFTVNTDGSDRVQSIRVNGNTPEGAGFYLANNFVTDGSVFLSGCPANGSTSTYYLEWVNNGDDVGNGVVVQTPVAGNIRFRVVKVGTDYDFVIYPMLESGTAKTDYEPYVGTTHTATFPSAIYRGSEDVVGGDVECEIAVADFADMTWTLSTLDRWVANDLQSVIKNPGNTAYTVTGTISEQYEQISADALYADSTKIAFSIHTSGAILVRNGSTTTPPTGKIAYVLATKSTEQITPTNLPIKSLSGYNHIESSTGDMEVEYITERFQPLIDSIAQL